MTLGQFKNHIESFEDGTIFNYGVSNPFSWRGVYAEVAFSIIEEQTTKKEILERINMALSKEFTGWKGGEFQYNENTDVHFEESWGSYTDGDYISKWIADIEQSKPYYSQEERFINLAFNN